MRFLAGKIIIVVESGGFSPRLLPHCFFLYRNKSVGKVRVHFVGGGAVEGCHLVPPSNWVDLFLLE